MKPLRGRREGSDCNILRQVALELTEKGGWVHRLRQFDIGNLAQGVDAQTHAAMKNLGAVLAAAGLGYQDILKTTIFVTDLKDFAAVNQAYGTYFASEPPARACVQVAALPLGGLVEVECVAARQAD